MMGFRIDRDFVPIFYFTFILLINDTNDYTYNTKKTTYAIAQDRSY